jgi:hypothetical protein
MEASPRRSARASGNPALPIGSSMGVASLIVLLLNDHVLKSAWPGAVTGKLSDVAGLVVLPLFLASVAIIVARLAGRSVSAAGRQSAVRWSAVAAAIGFALVKTVEPATTAYEHLLGVLQWPARALASVASGHPAPGPQPVILVADVTDLLALPVLLLFFLEPRTLRVSGRAGRLGAAALLTASSVALVATSPIQPPAADILDRAEFPLSLQPGSGFLGVMTITLDDGAAVDGSALTNAQVYLTPAPSKESPAASEAASVRLVVVPLATDRQPLTTASAGAAFVGLESLSLGVGPGRPGCEERQGRCRHRYLVDVSLEPGSPAFEGNLAAWASARFEFRSAEPEASVSPPAGASVDVEIVPAAEAAEAFRAGPTARLAGTATLEGTADSDTIGVRSTLADASVQSLSEGGLAVLRLRLGGESGAFDEGVVATIRQESGAPPRTWGSAREFGWSNEGAALLLFPFDGCVTGADCTSDLVIALEDASGAGVTGGARQVTWAVEVLTYVPRGVPPAGAETVALTDLCAVEPAACVPPSPTPAPTPEGLRASIAGILAEPPRVEAGAMTFTLADGRAWTVNESAWRLYGPEPEAEAGVLLLSGRSQAGDWWATFAPAPAREGCFVITDRATFTPQLVTFDSRLTLIAGPDLDPDLTQPMPRPARSYCLDERGRVTGLLDPS